MENISAIPNILHSFKEEQKKKKVTNFDTNEHERVSKVFLLTLRKERKGYLVIGPICEVGRSHFQFWFICLNIGAKNGQVLEIQVENHKQKAWIVIFNGGGLYEYS